METLKIITEIFIGVVILYLVMYVIAAKINNKAILTTKRYRFEPFVNKNATEDKKAEEIPISQGDIEEARKSLNNALTATPTLENTNANIISALKLSIESASLWLKHKQKTKTEQKSNQRDQSPILADSYYFLPTASLTIKATATVVVNIVNFDDGTSSNGAKLTSLQLENTVNIEPDTNQLLTLQYNSFSFANDEIKLTTNNSGLLETISSTAEDRISSIIAEVSEAPKKILSAQKLELAVEAEPAKKTAINTTTQTTTYLKAFTILSEELQNGQFSRDWFINIDGSFQSDLSVDASFNVSLPAKRTKSLDGYFEIEGVLTRPLQKIKLSVTNVSLNSSIPIEYNILMPDPSMLIQVPIKRSLFVKKINLPKFSNGLLIENNINKPSEVEAAVSIPINILKAIFSIPAQLLSFKIAHVQQQTAFETASQNLAKIQMQSQIDRQANDIQLMKVKAESEKATSQNEILNKITDLTSVQKQDLVRKELENDLQQLEIKKNLLSQLTNKDFSKLTKLEIDNINGLQQEIQLLQTRIDTLKITLGIN
jgi:hypothetical protein